MVTNRTNYLSFIFLISPCIFLFYSCKDKETYDFGHAYYPLSIGSYKIYQAQEVSYDPNGTTVKNFEIKEVLTEVFTMGGEERYTLERFRRNNNTLPWPTNPDSVWTVAFSTSKVVKVENNTRLIKLVFPVENGKTWNGNAENNYGEDQFGFYNIGKPFTVLSQNFENTASVVESDGDSSHYLSKDYRMEVYAMGVGMIYKVKEIYEYRQGGGVIDKTYKIDDGIKYYERLISYGQQ